MAQIVISFHKFQSFDFRYDPKNARDLEAKSLKRLGYKIQKFCCTEMMYPPSTFPPKRYIFIHKVPVKIYGLKAKRRRLVNPNRVTIKKLQQLSIVFLTLVTLATVQNTTAALPTDSLYISESKSNEKIELSATMKTKKEIPLWLDALIALTVLSITTQFICVSQYHK
jgi:hypothetical protein